VNDLSFLPGTAEKMKEQLEKIMEFSMPRKDKFFSREYD